MPFNIMQSSREYFHSYTEICFIHLVCWTIYVVKWLYYMYWNTSIPNPQYMENIFQYSLFGLDGGFEMKSEKIYMSV